MQKDWGAHAPSRVHPTSALAGWRVACPANGEETWEGDVVGEGANHRTRRRVRSPCNCVDPAGRSYGFD